jgi:hypothetical protein
MALMVLLSSFQSFSQVTISTLEKKADSISLDKTTLLTSPIIIKNFVKKNGEVTTRKEFYVRSSIQDYYIKFCESNISRDELETHLSKITDDLPILTLEVTFRDGLWDSCDAGQEQQSRTGTYLSIHRIVAH